MPILSDGVKARSQEMLSTGMRILPQWARRLVARRVLGLDGPNDRYLRWRVADRAYANGEWIVAERSDWHKKDKWENVILGASSRDVQNERVRGANSAVAYRLGRVVMIGVHEVSGDRDFLHPTDGNGDPNGEPTHMSVVMRIGKKEPLVAAIGTASPDGRNFRPEITHDLGRPGPTVPEGLYRV